MLPSIAIELALFSAAAFTAVGLARAIAGWRWRRAVDQAAPAATGTAFLFEGEDLADASGPATRLLAAGPRTGAAPSDLKRLCFALGHLFGDLVTTLDALGAQDSIELTSEDGAVRLVAQRHGGMLRIEVTGEAEGETPARIDGHTLAALERELDTLRLTNDHDPTLVWRQDESGSVTWINRAYADAVCRLRDPASLERWPLPALFDPADLRDIAPGDTRRCRIGRPGDAPEWYDLRRADQRDGATVTATDVTEAVEAEARLAAFTQTLTKTFAHLTVGLAVFDRGRELTIFNPALTDLTGLPVEFLAGRPRLTAFLDGLRERRMIPEPKDYQSWRARIAAMEAAATDGSYADTWNLPSGQTFRVTGRPHPDGALALFIEDVSADMTLTRRFRAELQMSQAVLDTLDEAVAVFAPSGILAMSNAAYADLWGVDPSTGLADLSLSEACRTWQQKTMPSSVSNTLRTAVLNARANGTWTAPLRLKDGRGLTCRIVPLSGGTTLVGFGPATAPTTIIAPLREPA